MAVVLADLLDPAHVTLDLRAQTGDQALPEIIATMLSGAGMRDAEMFLAEVVTREKVHTTYVGNGIAFPHARTDLVSEIVLGIGRSVAGIPFGEEGERAHLIFVIGVPKRMVNDYLVCVGALARLTKEPERRGALMNAGRAEELIEILRAGSLLLK